MRAVVNELGNLIPPSSLYSYLEAAVNKRKKALNSKDTMPEDEYEKVLQSTKDFWERKHSEMDASLVAYHPYQLLGEKLKQNSSVLEDLLDTKSKEYFDQIISYFDSNNIAASAVEFNSKLRGLEEEYNQIADVA